MRRWASLGATLGSVRTFRRGLTIAGVLLTCRCDSALEFELVVSGSLSSEIVQRGRYRFHDATGRAGRRVRTVWAALAEYIGAEPGLVSPTWALTWYACHAAPSVQKRSYSPRPQRDQDGQLHSACQRGKCPKTGEKYVVRAQPVAPRKLLQKTESLRSEQCAQEAFGEITARRTARVPARKDTCVAAISHGEGMHMATTT